MFCLRRLRQRRPSRPGARSPLPSGSPPPELTGGSPPGRDEGGARRTPPFPCISHKLLHPSPPLHQWCPDLPPANTDLAISGPLEPAPRRSAWGAVGFCGVMPEHESLALCPLPWCPSSYGSHTAMPSSGTPRLKR